MMWIIIGSVLAVLLIVIVIFDIRLYSECKTLENDTANLMEKYKDRRKRDYSGQASWGYASVRFDDLKNDPSRQEDGGVLVKVRVPFDSMRAVKHDDVVNAGKILEDMGIGEVYHVSIYEFLVFTRDCCETSESVLERFNERGDPELWYAVAAEKFLPSEQSIKEYLRRMKRGIAAAEANECKYAIY